MTSHGIEGLQRLKNHLHFAIRALARDRRRVNGPIAAWRRASNVIISSRPRRGGNILKHPHQANLGIAALAAAEIAAPSRQ